MKRLSFSVRFLAVKRPRTLCQALLCPFLKRSVNRTIHFTKEETILKYIYRIKNSVTPFLNKVIIVIDDVLEKKDDDSFNIRIKLADHLKNIVQFQLFSPNLSLKTEPQNFLAVKQASLKQVRHFVLQTASENIKCCLKRRPRKRLIQ